MHTDSEHPLTTPSAVTSEPAAADVHAQGTYLTSRVLIYLRERLAAVPAGPWWIEVDTTGAPARVRAATADRQGEIDVIGACLVSPAVMRFITASAFWMPPLLTAVSSTDLPERTDHDNTAAVLGSLRSRIAARLAQHRATPPDESRIDTGELSSKNPVRHGYDLGLSDVLALIDDISAQPPLPTDS